MELVAAFSSFLTIMLMLNTPPKWPEAQPGCG
jgi:hypothetical protein